MRKTAAFLALALLSVTGCSAILGVEEGQPLSAASESAEPVTQLTKKEACVELFGMKQDGPLFESIEFISVTFMSSDTSDDILENTAIRLLNELNVIHRQAPDEFVPLLDDYIAPLDEMVSAFNGTLHDGPSADIEAFKAAGVELLETCEVYDQSGL